MVERGVGALRYGRFEECLGAYKSGFGSLDSACSGHLVESYTVA